MKILFIVPGKSVLERIGISYLSAALKKNNFNVSLIIYDSFSKKRFKHQLTAINPDIVAFSVMSGEYKQVLNIAQVVKNTISTFIVAGGPHPTFYQWCINENSFDAICIGEGDAVFVEFCRKFVDGGDFWNTDNFIVKHNNKIYKNKLAPLITNLDSLPFPDRKILYDADPSLMEENYKLFFSARGCSFKCSYCFNDKLNSLYNESKQYVRYRSPENFITEIKDVKENSQLEFVYIDDDNFLIKPLSWIKKFAVLYKREIGLPFSCHFHLSLVNEDIIKILKEAGLHNVWVGIECADPQISSEILNRDFNENEVVYAFKIIKKYKIKISTQNLLGLPVKDSFQNDLKTLDFNIRLKPFFAWSSILYPYYNTEIYKYAKDNQFLNETYKELETNKRETVFLFNSSEKRKIQNLHKLFWFFVRYPVFRSYAEKICNLPLSYLYLIVYYLAYGYYIRFYLFPINGSFKILIRYFKLFLDVLKLN